jgi:MoxR-like ATPase
VDEVFKANSAILNALLTILNERLFDNGSERKRVPLLCLVGASNEMPESEELDALYDRFLLRRSVRPLSQAGVRQLAALAARGGTDGTTFDHTARPLGLEQLRACRGAATKAVALPDSVVDLLVDLRAHLTDKCEPPVYVSDRRFGKCVTLLQVAAHANGAAEVTEYDCLLLEFVLGQRPGDSDKVRAFVLDAIASDAGLLRAELAFLGVFGRAARALSADAPDMAEVTGLRSEVADLVELLSARWRTLGATLEGEFPLLRANVWMGPAAVASATQVIAPVMRDNRAKVEALLREVLLLQAVVTSESDCSGMLEQLLPRRVKQYQKGISG